MKKNTLFGVLLEVSRPPFLMLTPVCVFLAYAAVLVQGFSPDSLLLILVLIGALAAHISVNAFNEFFDFKSGLDLITQKTPFSGGSGILPEHPGYLNQVFVFAVLNLAITVLVGFYFIWLWNWQIIPLGLAGVLLVYFYTTHVTKHPWLCLISPGAGFGLFMVNGVGFVLTGSYSVFTLMVSLVPFFLVNNLLLLNQVPDIEADKKVGRFHLSIARGLKTSWWFFTLFYLLAFLSIFSLFAEVDLSSYLTMFFVFFVLASLIVVGFARNMRNVQKLKPIMGLNVAVNLLLPTILAGILILESIK